MNFAVWEPQSLRPLLSDMSTKMIALPPGLERQLKQAAISVSKTPLTVLIEFVETWLASEEVAKAKARDGKPRDEIEDRSEPTWS